MGGTETNTLAFVDFTCRGQYKNSGMGLSKGLRE